MFCLIKVVLFVNIYPIQFSGLQHIPKTVGTGTYISISIYRYRYIEIYMNLWSQLRDVNSWLLSWFSTKAVSTIGWDFGEQRCQKVSSLSKIYDKIIKLVKNDVPQRNIETEFCIFSFILHNVIKRFMDSGGISVCKGQRHRLGSLRWYCIGSVGKLCQALWHTVTCRYIQNKYFNRFSANLHCSTERINIGDLLVRISIDEMWPLQPRNIIL